MCVLPGFRFMYDFTASSIRNEVNWASGPP